MSITLAVGTHRQPIWKCQISVGPPDCSKPLPRESPAEQCHPCWNCSPLTSSYSPGSACRTLIKVLAPSFAPSRQLANVPLQLNPRRRGQQCYFPKVFKNSRSLHSLEIFGYVVTTARNQKYSDGILDLPWRWDNSRSCSTPGISEYLGVTQFWL